MIEIEVDLEGVDIPKWIRGIYRDQLPFVTARTINAVALSFQKAQREHQHRIFDVRNRTFIDRSVKIKPFAKKTSLFARVSIDPPGGQERADILTKFESGGTKRPRDGRSLAVPADAQRLKRGRVRKADRPKELGFRLHGKGPEAEVFRGKKRTFLIRRPDGTGGIYRRTGSSTAMVSSLATRNVRDSNIQTLFRFTPTARIDSNLNFVSIAQRVVAAELGEAFNREFDRAVRTARSARIFTAGGTTRPAARRLSRFLAL